jgi:ribosomal protein S19
MRSKWKGAYCSPELKSILIDSSSEIELGQYLSESDLSKENNKELGTKQKPYPVYSRNSTILPDFIGKFVNIHNGHTWKTLEIKHLHVGYKFGELAITKKSPRYKMKFKK